MNIKDYSRLFVLLLGLLPALCLSSNAENTMQVFTEEKLNILVSKAEPQFTIKLKSNRTTGFAWFLRDYDRDLVKLIKHEYIAGKSQLVGAAGYELWTFKVMPSGFIAPQQTVISFTYNRPWASNETAKQLKFRISTSD